MGVVGGSLTAYRGLAECLACDGPGGHAREGAGQHDGIKPSNRLDDGWGRDWFARARRGGRETG